MRRMFCRLVLFLTVLAPVSLVWTGGAIPATENEKNPTQACIKEVRITRAQNPFREWDAKPSPSGQAKASIRAADIRGNEFDTLPGLSRYALEGGRLMGVEKKTREPVVSEKCFSALARVDATRIEPGQARQIGKLLCAPAAGLSLRDFVFFLLESQIVVTYWHVESVICLVSEDDSGGIYRASFRGAHIYFTNTRNEDRLDFSITIDRKTGAIALLGGP